MLYKCATQPQLPLNTGAGNITHPIFLKKNFLLNSPLQGGEDIKAVSFSPLGDGASLQYHVSLSRPHLLTGMDGLVIDR